MFKKQFRVKKEELRTSKNRTTSSNTWLRRQLCDEYVQLSKKDGYRSRSAYKLLEIDEKFKLLKDGIRIIDLGCAPGGWLQVASKLVKSEISGVDLLDIDPIENVDFMQADFNEIDFSNFNKFDLILSDMAPNTIGHKNTDHIKILVLCEEVFNFSKMHLNEGGNMVLKIFQGGETAELVNKIKKDFKIVKHFKPLSSRKESSEIYLIALNKKNIIIK